MEVAAWNLYATAHLRPITAFHQFRRCREFRARFQPCTSSTYLFETGEFGVVRISEVPSPGFQAPSAVPLLATRHQISHHSSTLQLPNTPSELPLPPVVPLIPVSAASFSTADPQRRSVHARLQPGLSSFVQPLKATARSPVSPALPLT